MEALRKAAVWPFVDPKVPFGLLTWKYPQSLATERGLSTLERWCPVSAGSSPSRGYGSVQKARRVQPARASASGDDGPAGAPAGFKARLKVLYRAQADEAALRAVEIVKHEVGQAVADQVGKVTQYVVSATADWDFRVWLSKDVDRPPDVQISKEQGNFEDRFGQAFVDELDEIPAFQLAEAELNKAMADGFEMSGLMMAMAEAMQESCEDLINDRRRDALERALQK